MSETIPDEFFKGSKWTITATRFNILMGIISLGAIPFINENVPLFRPSWWVGTIGLILYFAEAWATLFKINIVRARVIHYLSPGNFRDLSAKTPEPGMMFWYGFLMRFCFRFALILMVMMSFGVRQSEDPPTWGIIVMCLVVLFDLFVMMYTMFETRLFSTKREEEEDDQKELDEERVWRDKMVHLANDPKVLLKEIWADGILVAVAFIYTNALWSGLNSTFIEFSDGEAKSGSLGFALILILFSSIIFWFLFLLPVRLPYWVEKRIMVTDKKTKRRFQLSVLFGGISLIQPSLWHIVKLMIGIQ